MDKIDKESKKKKRSLYRQILIVTVGTVLVALAIMILANTFFIEKVYLNEKTKNLETTFDELKKADDSGLLYQGVYRNEFDRLCANGNFFIVIMTSDQSVVMSSSGVLSSNRVVRQFMNSILYEDNVRPYKTTSSYTIEKQSDPSGEDFVILWGNLPDGNTIVIRSAVESLRESAKISNQFTIIASIFAIILGIVISSIVSRRITKPVLELTELSKKMSDLDFNAKYHTRKNPNEVDELGENFNKMSDSLQETIGELKKTNAKLSHDIDIMGKEDEMRREFLSNVSHELKTPIALIEGYAEGLNDGIADDPENREYYLNVIIDESKKMDAMVRQLLSLNQLEFGQNDIEMDRFDIVPAISSMIRSVDIVLKRENIRLIFDDSKPVYVWGDEFSAEQIIQNYLSNAIHYVKNEKVIKINLEETDGKIKFSVFNTGDRIPEESLPHLWEKFYKVDKARTREYGGTGLGLSIVKALSLVYKEECGVENKDDGVLFYFTFDKA